MTDDTNIDSESPVKNGQLVENGEVLLSGGTELLQRSGAVVFVLASTLGLVFLLGTSTSLLDVEAWVRLRTLELFAMIAAIGIVVAIISRSTNGFVLSIGILLIGALIVPTKDMVYLALLASGRSLSEEVGNSKVRDGTELKGRDYDLASRIVTQLQQTPRLQQGRIISPEDAVLGRLQTKERQQALLAITDTVGDDRIATHLERLRYSGALGLLLSFDLSEGYSEFYYRYGEEADFLEDLQTLRSQELIRYNYTDVSEAEITLLGKQVYCDYMRLFDNAECPFESVSNRQNRVNERLAQPVVLVDGNPGNLAEAAMQSCQSDFEELESITPAETVRSFVQETSFSRKFAVPSGEAKLEFELSGTTSRSDPYLFLLKREDSGGCLIISRNDDIGAGLDSRISETIQPGTYVLFAGNLMSSSKAPMRLRYKVVSE